VTYKRLGLDPPLSDAQLLALKAERDTRAANRASGGGVAETSGSFRQTSVLPRPRLEIVRIRLPWSTLVSDNQRSGATSWLGKEYRAAVARARIEVQKQLNAGPIDVRVRVEGRLWEPNRQRRDIANYEKLALDALKKLVYADDDLVDEIEWTRAGVDVDAPRLELTVIPLLSGASP
jgi:Holliday junction resolvase RusA-like endonuclease